MSGVAFFWFTNTQLSRAGGTRSGVVDGATIKGVVRFPEDYPEREIITITKDQAVCGSFQYTELFVVSEKTHGLANVVVSVQGLKGDVQAAGSVLTMAQNKRRYVPQFKPCRSEANCTS